jgi:prepilin-type N-terminal cleavage/methylation domain-containing protein
MKRARTEGGFSLIEVMCALFILGIGLVGLVRGINTALGSGKEVERQSIAAMLAAGQIEALRADGFYVEGDTDGAFDGALSIYTWRENIKAVQPEGLFEVTVSIEMTQGGEQIYALKTMVFDPPIVRDPDEKDKDKEKKRKRQNT